MLNYVLALWNELDAEAIKFSLLILKRDVFTCIFIHVSLAGFYPGGFSGGNAPGNFKSPRKFWEEFFSGTIPRTFLPSDVNSDNFRGKSLGIYPFGRTIAIGLILYIYQR